LVRSLVGDAPATVAVLSSFACGVLFLFLLGYVVGRYALPDAPAARAGVVALLLLPCVWGLQSFAAHFATGMDTTFALAYVSLLIWMGMRYEADPSARSAAALAVVAGLAFHARPDLVIYSAAVVIALLVAHARRPTRRRTLGLAAAAALLLAGQVLFSWAYLGSPFPLSFFTKSLVRYGAGMEEAYASIPHREGMLYLRAYGFFLVPIAARIGWDLKRRRWSFSATETGCLVATLAFLLYYRFCVLQVMPHYQRFYYPTLPPILFLAARSLTAILDAASSRPLPALRRAAAWLPALCLAAAFTLVRPWPEAVRTIARGKPFFDLPATANLEGWSRQWWYRLETLSRLPDDVVWATTEIGLPGVLNPRRTIVDLSGLNEKRFAQHGFRADDLFGRYAPDLIYMPPEDYREMNDELLAYQEFQWGYELIPAGTLGTKLSIALRKRSPHYAEMRAAVLDAARAASS